MCGLRTCPRTDVDPPRFSTELPSAGGHIVSPPPSLPHRTAPPMMRSVVALGVGVCACVRACDCMQVSGVAVGEVRLCVCVAERYDSPPLLPRGRASVDYRRRRRVTAATAPTARSTHQEPAAGPGVPTRHQDDSRARRQRKRRRSHLTDRVIVLVKAAHTRVPSVGFRS